VRGTHCRATGDIGLFTIGSEGGVAAGVRRIEAFTGLGAWQHHRQQAWVLAGLSTTLNTPPDQALGVVERLQHDNKRLAKEVADLKVKAAMGGSASRDDTVEVAGIKMVARRVAGLDKNGLRSLSDSLRDGLGSGVVVLASEHDGKVALVVSVTRDLTGRVQAGQVVKRIAPIVGEAAAVVPISPRRAARTWPRSTRCWRRAATWWPRWPAAATEPAAPAAPARADSPVRSPRFAGTAQVEARIVARITILCVGEGPARPHAGPADRRN